MKKIPFLMFSVLFLLAGPFSILAQQANEKELHLLSEEEDEGPLVLKFEPEFMTSVEIQREEIKRKRAIIDTLKVSDRKRRRLLRELYKNGISERLSRAMVAETKFDDEADEDIEN